MKKKYKKLTAITICSAIVGILGITLLNAPKYNETKAVNYDDTGNSILLTKKEQEEYKWNNLYTFLNTSTNASNVHLTYNGEDYFELEKQNDNNFKSNESVVIDVENENTQYLILGNSELQYKFKIYDSTEEEILNMKTSYGLRLDIYENDELYENLKQAVMQDVQYNNSILGSSIIGGITDGLGLIPNLAEEFLKGFTALFYDTEEETLTNFGYFSCAFLGISITMAVINLAMYLIRKNSGV